MTTAGSSPNTQLFSNSSISLNKEQLSAVNHPPNVPLQILAGPGSGKTKVLTARVAYLVHEKGIPPSQICAVTFTNKAANEMKERLKKLIGSQHTNALVTGTFHALCAKFLRRYGSCIALRNNFTICDAEESKKIITKILKDYTDELSSLGVHLKEAAVLASISKAKAKGLSPRELGRATTPLEPIQEIIARIYEDYAAVLKECNSLDFDDLLMYGVKLFTKERRAVMWCRHVLVDEFQDTNSMQYELMVRLASIHGCVTIVGDPDQSIYGWRSAEVANLGQMRKDFPLTHQVFLEENYRSTGGILAACLAIVSQDKSRIDKSLRTSHATGTLPTLQSFDSEQAESQFIAQEIKRLVAYSGGMLGWNDFVVLLRFNALSRAIEAALQKEGIPNRILAGQKFFERLEIKDILAYLQIIDNPSYTPAFTRAAHTPPRGLGDKSISELILQAKRLCLSPMDLAERIYAGSMPDIKPAVKRKLESLVKPVVALRDLANKGASVSNLIQRLLLLIDYEAHLKRSQTDWETRWENVQELINFASSLAGVASEKSQRVDDDLQASESVGSGDIGNNETPLRTFLQASMLSVVETKDENKADEKVTISTCHSAKGLEWLVVFVPAVAKGIFPFYRAEDTEEERRLLYVACTRAQGLLYLSHSSQRMAGGVWANEELSEFVSKLPRTLFTPCPPVLTPLVLSGIAKLAGREPVDEEIVQRKIREYDATVRSSTHNAHMNAEPLVQMSGGPIIDANFSIASATVSNLHSRLSSFGPGHTNRRLPAILQGTSKPNVKLSSCFGSSNASSSMTVKRSLGIAPNSILVAQTPLQSALTQPLVAGVKALPSDTTNCSQAQHALSQGQNIKLAAGKRRLGMGRQGTNEYPNKKPKGSS